jgi:O-antigen/teichoic acid export membrane protein
MVNRKSEKVNRLVLKTLFLLRNVASKGLFHLVSANILIGFFGFGSQLLVAKLLSPTELGQIRTIQSYIGVASIIAGFGFNGAVLKLCSEKRGLDEKITILRECFYYSMIPIPVVVFIVILLAGLRVLSLMVRSISG